MVPFLIKELQGPMEEEVVKRVELLESMIILSQLKKGKGMVMMRLMLNGSMDLYIRLILDGEKILQIMISGISELLTQE